MAESWLYDANYGMKGEPSGRTGGRDIDDLYRIFCPWQLWVGLFDAARIAH